MVRLAFSDAVEPERRRRLEYALGEILRLGGLLVPEGTTVGYGAKGSVSILPAATLEPAGVRLKLTRRPPGRADWPAELFSLFFEAEATLPGEALYTDGSGRALATLDEDVVHLAADPLATAWFLLSQEEERRFPDRRDEHGRLSLAVTRLTAETFARPWLESWGRFFAAALSLRTAVVRVGRHPEGAPWSLALTHDVDSLSERSLGRALRLSAAGILKMSPAHLAAAGRMLRLLGRPDRHRCLELCVEADAPSTATYFFHAGRRGRLDPEYRLEKLKKELDFLQRTGQELGLHYGYQTAGDEKRLAEELAAFERAAGLPPTGGRAHYLHLRGPEDLEIIARTSLAYDSSLGFPDSPGFRLGTGGPYRVWDEGTDGAINLFELPLVVMDGALFKRYGEGEIDVEDAWDRVRPYLDAAREAGAACCILWHQRVFGPAYPGWGEVYRRILAYARQNGAWCGPAAGLITQARAAEQVFVKEGKIINNSNKIIKLTIPTQPGKTVELSPGENIFVS